MNNIKDEMIKMNNIKDNNFTKKKPCGADVSKKVSLFTVSHLLNGKPSEITVKDSPFYWTVKPTGTRVFI